MSKVDDELTARFHRAERPVGSADLFDGLAHRRRRRRTLQRVQAAALAVTVIAATAGGFVALRAVFDERERDIGNRPSLPANGEIVFSRTGDDGHSHLFAAQPDGSGVRQITDDGTNDTDPAVSPDGRTIAYVHELDQGIQVIATVPIDGGTVTWHTPDDLEANDPAWSWDGDRIAFSAWAEQSGPGPPGSEAPERYRAIFVVDAASGSPQRVTDGGIPFTTDPSWSPDGRWVAIAGGSCAPGCGSPIESDLWLVDPVTTDARRLTAWSPDVDEEAPAWSPDGSRIAFTRPGERGDEVWTVAPDGSDETLLATAAEASLDPDLAWAPDGSSLLVSDGDWIYRMDATPDGDPRSNFVQLVRGLSPSWQPVPAASEATATVSPNVSPSPTPVNDDVGFGFGVCEVSHVRAQFDGLGAEDTAYVATQRAEDGSCPSNVEEAPTFIGIDLDEDGLVDESFGPITCDVYYCRTFAAPDLDADVGRHELLVVESAGSIVGLGMYALGVVDGPAGDEPGIVRIEVGEPDDPAGGFVTGEPVTLYAGGDEGWSYRLSCEDRPEGRVLVAASAYREVDSSGPVVIHETTLAYGELRMIVVDVVEHEEPVSDDPLGPQPDDLCGTPIPAT